MRVFLLAVTICLSSHVVTGQVPDWHQKLIKLQEFPSTEKQLEELFNSPPVTHRSMPKPNDSRLTKVFDYELTGGKLSVFYSAGKCSESNTKGYDLEDGTILSYYFHLTHRIEFSQLRLKQSKLVEEPETDTKLIYYHDRQRGVTYSVFEGKLLEINFFLPSKYYKRCFSGT